MEHTMKWLLETLNITRKKYRVYQDNGLLLPYDSVQRPRVFTEQDINRIWALLFLEEIGYTIPELKQLFNNPDTEFSKTLIKKSEEYNLKLKKTQENAKFLRIIRMNGLLPLPQHNQNYTVIEFAENARTRMLETKIEGVSLSDHLDFLLDLDSNSDLEKALEKFIESPRGVFFRIYPVILEYFKIIVELIDNDYKADAVQKTIGLFHKYYIDLNIEGEFDIRKKEVFSMTMVMQLIVENDVSEKYCKLFGEEKCYLMAEAFSYYGGYSDMEDLLEKTII